MSRVAMRQVGQYGVVLDMAGHELPPNAWTLLRNCRAVNSYIEPIGGEADQFDAASPVDDPMNLFYCPTVTGLPYWVYGGREKIGACNDLSHVDITPASTTLTATDKTRWSGAWLNGIFTMNCENEELLVWDNIDPGSPVLMKRMSAIASTEFNTAWRFNSVRPFKQLLIGIGFNDGTTDYPTVIKWSAPALAGDVPIGWDAANENNISGEYPLSETPGHAVDGAALGNNFIICKQDSTFRVSFGQGSSPLVFNSIDLVSGVIGLNCMVEFRRGEMLIFNQNLDVVTTEGTYVKSILEGRMREALRARVNPARLHQCYVSNNPLKKEVWICYPTVEEESSEGALCAQEALVWNYKDNTLQFADLGRMSHLGFGRIDTADAAPIINDIDVVINQMDWIIDAGGLEGDWALVGCSYIRNAFYKHDVGETIDGAPLVASLEKYGVAFVDYNRDGVPQMDHHNVKVCEGVWPTFEVAGTQVEVDITVGGQEFRDGPIIWDGPYTFTPGASQEMDFFVEGIYINLKYRIETAEYWKLHAHSMNISSAGDVL